jgi:Na+/H+ antiporter NhaC
LEEHVEKPQELQRTVKNSIVTFDHMIGFFSQNYYLVLAAAFVFFAVYVFDPFNFKHGNESKRSKQEWEEIKGYWQEKSDPVFINDGEIQIKEEIPIKKKQETNQISNMKSLKDLIKKSN